MLKTAFPEAYPPPETAQRVSSDYDANGDYIFPDMQRRKDWHGKLPLDYITRNLEPECDTHMSNNLIPYQPTPYDIVPRKTKATVVSPARFEQNRAQFGEVETGGIRWSSTLADFMAKHYMRSEERRVGKEC